MQAVAFSPGSKMLAVVDGMDDSTYLWDIATKRLVATLVDHGFCIVICVTS